MAQTDLDLVSQPAVRPDDADLVERVRAKLTVVFADLPLEVKAKAGVVTLAGQIRDSAQSRAASLITHRVEGVTNVVNKLTIGRGPLAFTLLRGASASKPKATTVRKSRRMAVAPSTESTDGEPAPAA